MPVFGVQASGAMPSPGDAYGVGAGKYGAPTVVHPRRSRPGLPIPSGGQCPGLDPQSPLGHGCNWLANLGYACAEWRLMTQDQRVTVVRNRLLDNLDELIEIGQAGGQDATRRDIADRGFQNQVVGWINDWCLAQSIREVGERQAMSIATDASMKRAQKPSGAIADYPAIGAIGGAAIGIALMYLTTRGNKSAAQSDRNIETGMVVVPAAAVVGYLAWGALKR